MNNTYWDGENWLKVIQYKIEINYYFNGYRHRNNGPAEILLNKYGDIIIEEYCYYGKTHNINGPAYIEYDDNDKIKLEEYWYNGKIFNPGNLPFEMPIDTEEKELYMKLKYGDIND